jgi:hypothetical protein
VHCSSLLIAFLFFMLLSFFPHMCVRFRFPILHFFVYHEVTLNLFSSSIVFCLLVDYLFYCLSFFLLSLSSYRWFSLFLSPTPFRNFHSRNVPLQSSIDAYTFPSLIPPASTLLAGTGFLRLFTTRTLHYINPVLGLPASFLDS